MLLFTKCNLDSTIRRLLFMNNKNTFKILLVYPNLPLMTVPPLSMAIFSGILKEEGYNVELFDTTSYIADEATNSTHKNRQMYLQYREYKDEDDLGIVVKTNLMGDFKEKVNKFKPDLMIWSVVEDAFQKTLKMAETIKDYDCVKIFGGVLPSSDPEYVINHKNINFISKGEGEITLRKLAKAVYEKKDYRYVKGTWYKNKDNSIIKNPPQPLVNINDSTSDFSLFDPKRFNRPMGGKIFKVIPVETYRGCPYACTFCNSPVHNTNVKKDNIPHSFLRRKTMKKIRSELLSLIEKYDPNFIYLVDDSFLARPKSEIFEFCDMYEEFKIPFWFNTRPENCKENILKRLKKAGSYRISFGVECGNEEFRAKILKRKPTNEQIIKAFKVIEKSGIVFSLNLIIGFPGETRDLVIETINLVKKIRGYDAITVSIFTPYRGTVLRQIAIKNNWLDSEHLTVHTTSSSILKMPPPYLQAKEIDGLIRTIPLYIYFPYSEWNEIKKAEFFDETGNKVFKKYSEIYKNNFLKSNQDDKKVFIDHMDTAPKSFQKKTKLSKFDIDTLTLNQM